MPQEHDTGLNTKNLGHSDSQGRKQHIVHHLFFTHTLLSPFSTQTESRQKKKKKKNHISQVCINSVMQFWFTPRMSGHSVHLGNDYFICRNSSYVPIFLQASFFFFFKRLESHRLASNVFVCLFFIRCFISLWSFLSACRSLPLCSLDSLTRFSRYRFRKDEVQKRWSTCTVNRLPSSNSAILVGNSGHLASALFFFFLGHCETQPTQGRWEIADDNQGPIIAKCIGNQSRSGFSSLAFTGAQSVSMSLFLPRVISLWRCIWLWSCRWQPCLWAKMLNLVLYVHFVRACMHRHEEASEEKSTHQSRCNPRLSPRSFGCTGTSLNCR